ncbi:DNA topoisomerase 2 isoform X2 [Harmonia axyridis]|uniref:DNA topoisomerase 2 isoform X2 n=1 Tax=Harmonia axyridis TaxID=115357 RepID=UPI001E277B46|nr:DNA topoisomerase 2 isoform X2 [Harmonia axyridis]
MRLSVPWIKCPKRNMSFPNLFNHSIFARMNSHNEENGGDGDKVEEVARPAPKPKKAQTIEKMYQKKSQLEHILLRPDTYIGSVEKTTDIMWIYNEENKKMEQKQIEYVPGLYKIFDEILVNAADNKQRDPKMDCIKIDINAATNTISVYNNGHGIPVVMHKEENMFVPTMIFGHLLTSSNYNDEEEKVTGGRNGYGAKLCNIFSTKFTVETASKEFKKHFKQTWGSNMTKASEPKVKDFTGEEFTKITFSPDLEKFKMTELDDGIVGLMSRRAFDVAASTKGVKVYLNGSRVPVKNFKDYIDHFLKDKEDDAGNPLKVVYEQAGERWEVGLTTSDKGFQQMSFVNSIATTKGGKHVDYVSDMITKQLIEVLKKKNKGGVTIKPFQVKNHMWVFVNCLIVNPTFDSQTKENMTLQSKNFGSKCTLSEKFTNQVIKSGIIEQVLSWAKFKAQNELQKKTAGKKQSKLKGIPKLEDANEAGTKNALQCTLILTEGDSAKSLAVSGLGVIGRDYYGVFPLRGKLLNVREATHKQILENAEINNLIRILGLQYKKKYTNVDDMKTLRYGKVMIMTDQDQDGSHIKGLLINFIHHNWPDLLKMNFLEEFITPIVKATKKNEEHSFYSLPEFEEWRTNTPNNHTYNIKYYKGLGTSTSKEAKEYFTNMAKHRIKFRYDGQTDDDHIMLAFSKKHVDHRKEWLTNFMVESRRRKELGLAEKYLYQKDTKYITYTDFINLELVLFSNADNIRSIPSMVDGLKPGQRKVVYTCIKRNDKREVKVAQLAGSVAEMSAYHHGEVSLCMTIVNLAQNFVGSNNINLLEPRGQFGTRLAGGKDSASPRYIFTKMSPLTRLLFHPDDDAILKHEFDDNQKIEPVWYIPIIPMVLVNGADGIGTGWMTKIPNFNPKDIIDNLKRMIAGEQPKPLCPWYKNFKGTIEDCGDQRYVVNGEISILGNNKLEITELPVHTWTQNYKESVLETLLHGSEKVKSMITDYKEYNTDTTIKFVITVTHEQMESLEKEGLHKVFKLQSMINMSSMCAFDELGCLKKYESVMTILEEFYQIRLKMYQKRKDHLEGMLGAEVAKLSNQARFILEKCNGELTIENKKRKAMIDELISKGYEPDPVKEWKQKSAAGDDEQEDETEDAEESTSKSKKPVDPEKAFQKLTEVKKFDYLLGMSMWMLTEERKNELLRQRDNKVHELKVLKAKSNADLWTDDLNEFLDKLEEVEEKERKDEAGTISKDAKKAVGKKKLNLQETMPSPMGKRVEPIISDDLKKKIQAAIKSKENRIKKGTKKENISTEEDEFDLMIQKSGKNLKQKLGTPEGIENKVKKGTLKQTKLNFSKKTDNGTRKKKRRDDSASSDEERSGSEFSGRDSPIVEKREKSQRISPKKIKYDLDSEESNDDVLELHENEAIKETHAPVISSILNSDSESDAPPPPRNETSEDMFDSLIGKKPTNDSKKEGNDVDAEKNTSKRKSISGSESDSEDRSKNKNKKLKTNPKKATKKIMVLDSDSDSDHSFKDAPKKTISKKKIGSDSDSDFGEKLSKVKAQKKNTTKKVEKDSNSVEKSLGNKKTKKAPAKGKSKATKAKITSDSEDDIGTKKKTKKLTYNDDDSDSEEYIPLKTSRTARAAAQKKYEFSDDE